MVMSATATKLYSGQDLELHSGAGGSIVGSWDGATGTITAGHLLALTDGTFDIGNNAANTWRDLWLSRNADIDGTINVQGQGTFQANVDFGAGIDVTGSITVTEFVDTVDVAGHSHAVSGSTANTTPGLTGKTDNWATYGSPSYVTAIKDADGNDVYLMTDITIGYGYVRVATDSSGTGAAWVAYTREYGRMTHMPHTHNLTGGVADGACAEHLHAAGTLATGVPVNP